MKSRMLEYYMDVALRTAQLSRAQRLQVGCVIVKDDNIISYGWNGTPPGWDNTCEEVEWCNAGGWLSPEEIEEGWPYTGTYLDAKGNEISGRYRLKTKPEVIHAEANALLKLAGSHNSSVGATMFLTHAPCIECAKLVSAAKIGQLYYRSQYRSDDGLKLLEKTGLKITHLP